MKDSGQNADEELDADGSPAREGLYEPPYVFVFNNPVNLLDPFGLAFYAIDGTWSDARNNTNPQRLSVETREVPSRYWRGPRDGPTGLDSYRIRNTVRSGICRDFCDEKKNCRELEINMSGWSRGAVVVMGVAQVLNNEGCTCEGSGAIVSIRYHPVMVNWIGLFDAVEMMPGDRAWPSTVPSNVRAFAHAIKTARQRPYPTVRYGRNERAFNRTDGRPTVHNDIGARRNSGAYGWIKRDAGASGVDF